MSKAFDTGADSGMGEAAMPSAGHVRAPVEDVQQAIYACLQKEGLSDDHTRLVGNTILQAEVDGTASHGLLRLPGYLSSMRCGWVNTRPRPIIIDAAPGLLDVNADNGFAQISLAASQEALIEKARRQGVAALAMRHSHHFASLYPDIETFAAQGLLALTFVNTRSLVVAAPGARKILGTNPMAFACPRPGLPPMIWDQASSLFSRGDTLIHAKAGTPLPPGVGVDAKGHPTRDAQAVLEGGAFLTFGGYKGFSIAMMVEILAAALTGAPFGFEDESGTHPGAHTTRGGQTVILLDPSALPNSRFFERVESFFSELCSQENTRLPGDRRYASRARAQREGLLLAEAAYLQLKQLAADAGHAMP